MGRKVLYEDSVGQHTILDVVYVDQFGTQYPAVISGPASSAEIVEEAEFEDDGKTRKIIKPGHTIFRPAPLSCTIELGNDKWRQFDIPTFDLLVNFAKRGHRPVWGHVSGVSLEQDRASRITSPYYIPCPEPETPADESDLEPGSDAGVDSSGKKRKR